MNFLNYLEELYFERWLTSQFTFGFEFEGSQETGAWEDWKRYATSYFKGGSTIKEPQGELGEDDSVKGYEPFEYNSPIMNMTIENLQKVLIFLDTAVKNWVETNESCGFHIHIGFPDKGDLGPQMLWILLNLANASDKKVDMLKEILNYKNFELHSEEYAEFEYLFELRKNIKDVINEIVDLDEEKFIQNIKHYYTDAKFRLFRIHPQGTLEWRGPRGFLDAGMRNDIKGFLIKKLYPFVVWIAKVLDKKFLEMGDIKLSKEKLFKAIKKIPSPVERTGRRNSMFADTMSREMRIKVMKMFKWLRPPSVKFKNAYITISEKNTPHFESGTWDKGAWEDGIFSGTWRTGTFNGGMFIRGYWYGGIFENGTFKNSEWYNGTFKNGEFINSHWNNGTFKNGEFVNSTNIPGATHSSGIIKDEKILKRKAEKDTKKDTERNTKRDTERNTKRDTERNTGRYAKRGVVRNTGRNTKRGVVRNTERNTKRGVVRNTGRNTKR